jgi:glycosyltransferase involved in cell wall biosynthesis
MTETLPSFQWCCVQSGHRERYAIPRALHRAGVMDRLITDLWVPPNSLAARMAKGRLGRRIRDRFEVDLSDARVTSLPFRSLAWEVAAGLRGFRGYDKGLARNIWWGRVAARELRRGFRPKAGMVFGYSYEARVLFGAARELGLMPVLGQIDPGPVENAKVAEITKQWSSYRTSFQPATHDYYESWREECRLARWIIVNSEWSRLALEKAGIDADKIAVVPLVYTPPREAAGWARQFPKAFTRDRPLRVLFLGQCVLRKGIAETIEAAQRLSDQPVEFTFVGNTDIERLESHFGRGRIRCFPRVSRSECDAFYREADLFLFPTHSDGFGLTQLEAQAWKLPIIVSRFCAPVVTRDGTGWILDEVSGNSIASTIADILGKPEALAWRSEQIGSRPFGLDDLGRRLQSLEAARS